MALLATRRDSVTGGIISRPSCGSTSCSLPHARAALSLFKKLQGKQSAVSFAAHACCSLLLHLCVGLVSAPSRRPGMHWLTAQRHAKSSSAPPFTLDVLQPPRTCCTVWRAATLLLLYVCAAAI